MQDKNNKLDFSNQDVYAGLDVHKKDWKVTIMVNSTVHKTFTQPPDGLILSNYLNRNFPNAKYYSAYEAGFSGYKAHRDLLKAGIHSIVVSPADIPTTDKERRQKEDKRDSKKIARALSNGEIEAIYIPSEKALEDRFLLRTHYALTKDLTRYKQRIKSFLFFYGIEIPEVFSNNKTHWSRRFIEWLRTIKLKEDSVNEALEIIIAECENLRQSKLKILRQIKKLSKTEDYSKNVTLLISIPGIALLTAMKFLTELVDIKRFKNLDSFCSYIGLIPSTYSTGNKEITGDITPRRNKILRSSIIESAWTAKRIDPALMMSFNKLCQRMEANKAIIRIAKKLANRIIYVLRNELKYEISIVK